MSRPAGGATLGELAARGELPPDRLLEIIGDVAKALQAIHEAGLNHHALHPGVIHIGDGGPVVVSRAGFANPFGIGRAETAAAFAAAPAEVRGYVAPEMSDPSAEPDYRADIYALGAVLYRFLTRRFPTGFFVLPSKPSKLERRIDDIVADCLQHQLDRRWPDAGSLASALATIGFSDQVGEVVLTRPREDGEKRPKRRGTQAATPARPWLRAVAAAVVTGVLALVALGLYQALPTRGGLGANDADPFAEFGDPALIDGTRMTPEKRTERFERLGAVLDKVRPGAESFLRAVGIMQRLSDYPQAESVIARHLSRLKPTDPGTPEVETAAAHFAGQLAGYREAMATAAAALTVGDDRGERAALDDALGYLPDDARAAASLTINPVVVEERILSAVQEFEDQVGDARLHVSYRVARGRSRLDLSANPGLVSLEPLRDVALEELDLSGTSVRDLAPLRGMSLRGIWMDDSEVADLSALRGMPVESLAFERTPIGDPREAAAFTLLSTLRHTTPAGERVARIPVPEPGEPWENDLGMRFVPQEGINGALVSRWETRNLDLLAFRTDQTPETAAEAPDPRSPESRFPATGVTLDEAKAFCEWLTARGWSAGFLEPGMQYRLPSDAEWSALAGIDENPLLSPAARQLQGDQRLRRTNPHTLPVSHARDDGGELTGLADNGREWTISPFDESRGDVYAVRGFSALPAGFVPAGFDIRERVGVAASAADGSIGFRVLLVFGGAASDPPADGPDLAAQVAAGEWAAAAETASQWAASPPSQHHQDAAEAFLTINTIRVYFQSQNRLPSSFRKDVLYFRGHRYWLCPLPLDWETAKSLAESAAGHLVTFGSDEELAWFQQHFARPGGTAPTVWTGAAPPPGQAAPGAPSWIWDGGGSGGPPPSAPAPASPSHRLLVRPAGGGATWHQAPGHQRHAFLIEWG
jgi:hypothetical protein